MQIKRPRAVLFDFDGVIVDSHQWNINAFHQAAEKIWLQFRDSDFIEFFHGRALKDGVVAYLTAYEKMNSIDQFLAGKTACDDRYVEQAFPIQSTVNRIKKHTHTIEKIAIVTGSRRVLVDMFVEHYGLLDCIDLIVSAEDYIHGKPDPEPYEYALKKLWMMPWDVLVVEDSPKWMMSAHAAGIPCLIVNPTPRDYRYSDVVGVIGNMETFSLN